MAFSSKMGGLLAWWTLTIQEYEFTIHYRRGHENGNADALSWRTYPDVKLVAAASQAPILTHTLQEQQLIDPIIQQLHTALSQHSNGHIPPQGSKWHQPPLSRYKQLWPQLSIIDGIVCCQYAPNPHLHAITLPLIPALQHLNLLKQHHNIPSSGHWDMRKLLLRCIKLVIGLECCKILINTVESVLFVSVLNLQHHQGLH